MEVWFAVQVLRRGKRPTVDTIGVRAGAIHTVILVDLRTACWTPDKKPQGRTGPDKGAYGSAGSGQPRVISTRRPAHGDRAVPGRRRLSKVSREAA